MATIFKLVAIGIALAAGYMILQNLPDVQRYLKMRAM